MNFKPVALEDRAWMEPLLREAAMQGSEYTFSNCYNWRKSYGIEVAQAAGKCLVRTTRAGNSYLFPAGAGALEPAMEILFSAAREAGEPLRLHGLDGSAKEELEAKYPGRFAFAEVRDSWDYLYDREKLHTLAGKKLHGKRNHINRFLEQNQWSYEPITEENLPDCRAMNDRWCAIMGCDDHESLQEESCAVKSGLKNFTALGLLGGLLRVEGEVAAFTFASPVREDTVVVHVEKAFPEIQGAYPMINQQFIQNACGPFGWVNREDDLGEEGLRRAKLSYYPEAMVEKWTAEEILP